MVCSGYPPDYRLVPGFGPFSLGWGWLALGMLLGALITTVIFLSCSRFEGNWGQPTAADRERHNLLDHVRAHGRPALQEFAALAQTSEVEMLYRIVGVQPPIQRPPGFDAAHGAGPPARVQM